MMIRKCMETKKNHKKHTKRKISCTKFLIFLKKKKNPKRRINSSKKILGEKNLKSHDLMHKPYYNKV